MVAQGVAPTGEPFTFWGYRRGRESRFDGVARNEEREFYARSAGGSPPPAVTSAQPESG
jgi:hypothetical protein